MKLLIRLRSESIKLNVVRSESHRVRSATEPSSDPWQPPPSLVRAPRGRVVEGAGDAMLSLR
jgi:hypothetical protein